MYFHAAHSLPTTPPSVQIWSPETPTSKHWHFYYERSRRFPHIFEVHIQGPSEGYGAKRATNVRRYFLGRYCILPSRLEARIRQVNCMLLHLWFNQSSVSFYILISCTQRATSSRNSARRSCETWNSIEGTAKQVISKVTRLALTPQTVRRVCWRNAHATPLDVALTKN